MVRKDGSIQGFETNADWRVGDQQNAQEQRAVETGSNGSAPWGYLTQKLGKPANLSDFDAVAKPVAVILLTIVGTIALWLLASRFVAAARNEPLRYALVRDALFHAPITVGLLFLLLPRYDVRFPVEWPFQPKFVGAGSCRYFWQFVCFTSFRAGETTAGSRRTDSANQKHRVCRCAALSASGGDHRIGFRVSLQ